MSDDDLIKAGRAYLAGACSGNPTGALAAMRQALGVRALPAPQAAAAVQALPDEVTRQAHGIATPAPKP